MNEELTCSTCKLTLPKGEFSLRSTITGKRSSVCKKCHAIYRKKHYSTHAAKYKKQAIDWNKANDKKRKSIASKSAAKTSRAAWQLAVDYKGGKCQDCGGVFPNCCYDFHHLDPAQKDYHIAQLLNARGFEASKEELDKCVLLCSNCHRIRHHVKPDP